MEVWPIISRGFLLYYLRCFCSVFACISEMPCYFLPKRFCAPAPPKSFSTRKFFLSRRFRSSPTPTPLSKACAKACQSHSLSKPPLDPFLEPLQSSTMRSILSLGVTAVVVSTSAIVSAETAIAILEFGPGGSIHRTTSSAAADSTSAAVASLWNALHRPSSSSSKRQLHAGMSVVPDLFSKPDAAVVVGMHAESLKSMPTARTLMDVDETVDNVVGHVHVSGQAGLELMKLASSRELELIDVQDIGTRLQSTAETAARGETVGVATLFFAVDNDDDAAVADEQLGRMLQTLKKNAADYGKTVVLHLVVEEGGSSKRRRLEDNADNADADSSSSSSYNNQKSMYEIQSFNLYLWTSVGLFVVISMVMSAFIAMPLMPDTLLFGETAKIGSD